MLLNLDNNPKPRLSEGMNYATLLPNGLVETPAGTQSVPPRCHQLISGPFCPEGGNSPAQDRSRSPSCHFPRLPDDADSGATATHNHLISSADGLAALTQSRSPA